MIKKTLKINGVARFDKHRSATRATAYHVEAELLGNVQSIR